MANKNSEGKKYIGEFCVAWANEEGRNPEFHIYHGHPDENNKYLYNYCIGEDDGTYKCRVCKKEAPAGVVYFGKTRRLSEDNS